MPITHKGTFSNKGDGTGTWTLSNGEQGTYQILEYEETDGGSGTYIQRFLKADGSLFGEAGAVLPSRDSRQDNATDLKNKFTGTWTLADYNPDLYVFSSYRNGDPFPITNGPFRSPLSTLPSYNNLDLDTNYRVDELIHKIITPRQYSRSLVATDVAGKSLSINASSWQGSIQINYAAKAPDDGGLAEAKQIVRGTAASSGSILLGGHGNDTLRGKAGWDLIDGGAGNDLIRGGNGRDILIGGIGSDEIHGDFGWNTYKSEKDGFADLIAIKSDQWLVNWLYNKAGNSPNGEKCDIIEGLDATDRIRIIGCDTKALSFADTTAKGLSGVGIYANGNLEALYIGGDLSIAQIKAMTTGDGSAAAMANQVASYDWIANPNSEDIAPISSNPASRVDTSKPPATYVATSSSTNINEGERLTTIVKTTGVSGGTPLYYSLSANGINASDFSSGELTGSALVGSDGTFTLSHTLANDQTTEGDESLLIRLYSDDSRTKLVRSASLAKIIDTSRRQIPENLKITAPESINEGDGGDRNSWTRQLIIHYQHKGQTQTLYYKLSGNGITQADFSPGYSQNPNAITNGALSGSKALGAYPNDLLNISYKATQDGITEGNEVVTTNIYSDSNLNNLIGTADTVIYDASKSPLPSSFDPITGQKVYFSDLGWIESGKVYGKDDRWTSEDRLRSLGLYGNLGLTKQDMKDLDDFKLRFDFSSNYISITTSVKGDKRQAFNAQQTIGKDWTSRLVIQGSFEYSENGLTGASLGAQASQRTAQTPAGLVSANGIVVNEYYPILTDESNYTLLPVSDFSSWQNFISTYNISAPTQTPPGFKANYFNSAGGDPRIQEWTKDFGNGQFFYNGWETSAF